MSIQKISMFTLACTAFALAQAPQIIFETEWGNTDNQIGLREAPDARYAAQSFRVSADTVSILDGQNGQLK